MLSSLLLGATGFFVSSVAFYFTHRVVFHSHRSSIAHRIIFNKYNPLASLARWGRGIHLNHHREHIQSKRRGELEELNMFFPFKVKLFVTAVMTLVFIASAPFAIGMMLFFPFYSYRHTSVHRIWNSGKALKPWMLHHLYHHEKDPTVNHSGTIPFIDKVFGTNKKPPEEWINKNYPNPASSSS